SQGKNRKEIAIKTTARNSFHFAHVWLIIASLFVVMCAAPAGAFNYVVDASGTYWGIQDAALPVVDTGSIRATQIAPAGQSGRFTTAINGFGGINFPVPIPKPLIPALAPLTPGYTKTRYNGEMMRGFGLAFDGTSRFATTKSITLGGVKMSRSIWINTSPNWGRWLARVTNTPVPTTTV